MRERRGALHLSQGTPILVHLRNDQDFDGLQFLKQELDFIKQLVEIKGRYIAIASDTSLQEEEK